MPYWVQCVFYVIFGVMFISFAFAARYFIVIGLELQRARETGEATAIPPSGRGLPLVVIFMKNALPRVEKQRWRLVFALAVFTGGWIAVSLLGQTFIPHH
jgi:hypothetical protein